MLGVSALGLGLLTGCSDEAGDPVPAATDSSATITSEANSEPAIDSGECADSAPTGVLSVPTAATDYETGEAAFIATLSDGTEKCVVVQSDSSSGEFGTDKEIDIQFGDTTAGFLVTVDGEDAGNLPTEVPHQVKDAFMGLQVDGGYFADSMHSGCEVTITGFDAEMIAGEFTCKGVALFDGGPFSFGSTQTTTPLPLDTSLESAKGWFVVRA
jgi:hypothetical protein